MIMEAGKFWDRQSELGKLETQKSWRCSFILKAGRVQTQEDPMFQFKFEGRKKSQCPSFKGIRQEEFFLTQGVSAFFFFFFYSGLQLIGWSSLTLGRAVCFTQSTI